MVEKLRKELTSTPQGPVVFPRSQVLHELNHDQANTGQQKGVHESTLVHHELQNKPDDEKTRADVIEHVQKPGPVGRARGAL